MIGKSDSGKKRSLQDTREDLGATLGNLQQTVQDKNGPALTSVSFKPAAPYSLFQFFFFLTPQSRQGDRIRKYKLTLNDSEICTFQEG